MSLIPVAPPAPEIPSLPPITLATPSPIAVRRPAAMPIRYIPAVELEVDPIARPFQSLEGVAVYRGDMTGTKGDPMRVPLPDPRMLQVEGVLGEKPVAVFCPCCLHKAKWNGKRAEYPVRIMCIRYGPVGFTCENRGRDRFEWRAVSSTMLCDYGHFFRFHTDSKGEHSVRAWPTLPELP